MNGAKAMRFLIVWLATAALGSLSAFGESGYRLAATSDESFTQPHDLVLSSDGRFLFVSDVGHDHIAVLDPTTLRRIAKIGEGQLSAPHDARFDGQGRLIVADSGNDRVAIFEITGERGRYVGELRGELSSPEGVAVYGDRIYVTNAGSDDIVVFQNGKVIKRHGRRGSGRDQYRRPHDIDIDKDGRVFVADPGNNRIVVLDKELNWQKVYSQKAYNFHEPKYLAIGGEGQLFVADEYNNQVKILGKDGRLLATLGTGRRVKSATEFNRPEGVTVRGGQLWISDTYNNRIVRFERTK